MNWGQEYVSTGLIDECAATVLRSWFGGDPAYTNEQGEIILRLNWELGDIEGATDAPETITEKYSIGKGVVAVQDGTAVERTDGRPVKFNNNSVLGQIVKRVGTDPAFEKLADDFAASGANPANAGIWQGRRFRFAREERNYNIGGKDYNKTLLLPVEYLGTMGGGLDVFAKAEAALAEGGLTTVRDRLQVIAENASSQQTFAAAAIALPEVQADPALAQEVLSGSFYATSK